MKYSTAQIFWHYIELIKNYDFIASLLISMMFCAACFIAYRIYRLRVILVLFLAEVAFTIQWFYLFNFEFGGFEPLALYFPNHDMFLVRVIQDLFDLLLRITPTILNAIGATMALRYLIKKRKSIIGSQQGGPAYPPQGVGSADP